MYKNGYGLMKYKNNDEYEGIWWEGYRCGVGGSKQASTGIDERRFFRDHTILEKIVFEFKELGH